MSRRVVITGMGWITPLGHDVGSVWGKLLTGASAIAPVTRFDASTFATNFAAEVKNFRLEHFLDAKLHPRFASLAPFRHAGLNSQFALAAAAQAWKQARLDATPVADPRRFGMYLGSGEGSLDTDAFFEANLAGWNEQTRSVDGARWADAAVRLLRAHKEIEQEPNMSLLHVANAFGCRGPAFNCMTACAASNQAIGEATELIRRGDADVMFAGGAHSMIHPLGMTGFIRLTAMSTRRDTPASAARPFDATRDGFVMGEGAAMIVLESLEHARKRGVEPLAELAGYGSSADAFRITDIAPEHRGAQSAIRQALRQAGIDPREPDPRSPDRPRVHWFCAHGTGTKENDKLETAAVKAIFGPFAPKVPVSSIKSMLGHLIQAAGAAGTIACVQAIKTGFVPPTANYEHADPDCDLDVVPRVARDLNPAGGVDVCLNNAAGFGGQNDVLLVKRFVP
jgi:3-oxoacyl-[acyl-carrier-protein] synthase II